MVSTLMKIMTPVSSPGRYLIQDPSTPMDLETRAFQMWAVHPLDLDALGFKTRQDFYLAHLKAVKQEYETA